MKRFTLDSKDCKTVLDFYCVILQKIGAPSWHGHSINALIDSIVHGGINEEIPPYVLEIINMPELSLSVRQEINYFIQSLQNSCCSISTTDDKVEITVKMI